MNADCPHENLKCKDSRTKDGWRYRRYICKCGARFTTAEIQMSGPQDPGERAQFHKAELANVLSHKQCRSLLEQIKSGHKQLNLI